MVAFSWSGRPGLLLPAPGHHGGLVFSNGWRNDVIDLILSQITDVFRIGLIIALVITMRRTATVTGRFLPLVLGVVFVAVILPATLPQGAVAFRDAVAAGLVANLIILAPVLAVAAVIDRSRR